MFFAFEISFLTSTFNLIWSIVLFIGLKKKRAYNIDSITFYKLISCSRCDDIISSFT